MKWLMESELALKAATTSTDIIEQKTKDISVKVKDSNRDLVTELDVAIEKNIRDILNASGHHIIGEETSNGDTLHISRSEKTWFIDPIDGTTNMISSLPFYSISVGLVHRFDFVVGAVIVPMQKELFFTMGDSGSFMNDKALKSGSADLQNSLIAVAFSSKSSNDALRKKEYELFGMLNDRSRGCLRIGSASINICYVAAGRFQSAYGLSNKIWDVAGAIAVAARAGCRVYVEWIEGTNRINYVVGEQGVADKIAEMLTSRKMADVKLIS